MEFAPTPKRCIPLVRMKTVHPIIAGNLLSSLFVAAFLTSCASSLPSNFEYKSSVRGERGLEGVIGREKVVSSLFEAGVVKDPAIAFAEALPDSNVNVRKWGLRYFGSDWVRYQVRLDADILRGDEHVKCREVSTEDPVGAPTLPELLADDGLKFQRELENLIAACLAQVKDLT